MNTHDPVGLSVGAPQPVVAIESPKPIKPPSAAEKSPDVTEQRHRDLEKSEDLGTSAREESEELSLEAAIFTAHGLSEADMASVIEAQAAEEQAADKETRAEASRIKEAFQAGLSMTSLLEIIRGADLATISLLLGESRQQSVSEEGAMLPV